MIKEFKNYQPYDPNTQLFFISGIINAQPQYGTPQSLHTFQIKTTDYSGDIIIQGSQSNGGNPERWVDLEPITASMDPIIYRNIVGKTIGLELNTFRNYQTQEQLTAYYIDSILYV